LSIFAPSIALAQQTQIQINNPAVASQWPSLTIIIQKFFGAAIIVAGILFVVLLLIGGLQYLISLGEEEAMIKSRKLMLNATIGLFIVLSAWAVGNFILETIGLKILFN
jgi:hypothetical protein